MTRAGVAQWLASRAPAAPSALAARVNQVLDAFPEERLAAEATVSAVMGSLGVAALGSLEGRDPRSTEVALDLLAADAFVTYAFEAAAEEGAEVAPLVSSLIARAAA